MEEGMFTISFCLIVILQTPTKLLRLDT